MSKAGPLATEANMPGIYDENVLQWRPGVNKAAMAKGVQSVNFFYKSKLDPQLSKEEGRPRYQKIPYVRITQPGDRDNIVMRQVWLDETEQEEMADNVRFKDEWLHFTKNGESLTQDGTPLEAFPPLTREQVEELKHFNIITVEQLADMPDGHAAKFMGIRALQRLAKDYLEAAKDGAVVSRLHGELEEVRGKASRQEAALAEQAEMIRQLREMVEAQQRGRAQASLAAPAEPAEPHEAPVEPNKVEKSGGFLRPKKA